MEKGSRPPGLVRRRRQQLASTDRWLVSYADLMTLLFAFFVVLFATSHHSAEDLGKLSGAIHSGFSGTEAASGKPAPAPHRAGVLGRQPAAIVNPRPVVASLTPSGLDLLAAQLRGVLGSSIAQHEVSVEQTPDGVVISFQELGFFHSGEAELLHGQAAQIIATGAVLRQHSVALRVEGHSDDQPIHNAMFASNWELSAARAMTVLLLLVDQAHYDPTRISMAGYGPYRPVAENATPEGRQKNRRVDLVVVGALGIEDTSPAPSLQPQAAEQPRAALQAPLRP